jgi:hypothetical protein
LVARSFERRQDEFRSERSAARAQNLTAAATAIRTSENAFFTVRAAGANSMPPWPAEAAAPILRKFAGTREAYVD